MFKNDKGKSNLEEAKLDEIKKGAYQSTKLLIQTISQNPNEMGIESLLKIINSFLLDELLTTEDVTEIFEGISGPCADKLIANMSGEIPSKWTQEQKNNTFTEILSNFQIPAMGCVVSYTSNLYSDSLIPEEIPEYNCPDDNKEDNFYLYNINYNSGIVFQQAPGTPTKSPEEILEEIQKKLNEKYKLRNKYQLALSIEALFLPLLGQLKNTLEVGDDAAKAALRKSLEKAGLNEDFFDQWIKDPKKLKGWLRVPGNLKRFTSFLLKRAHWLGVALAAADVAVALKTLSCLYKLLDEIVDLEYAKAKALSLKKENNAKPGKKFQPKPYVTPSALGIKPGSNCSYKVTYFLDWIDAKEKNYHHVKLAGPFDMVRTPQGTPNIPDTSMFDSNKITAPTLPKGALFGSIVAEITITCGEKVIGPKRIILAVMIP